MTSSHMIMQVPITLEHLVTSWSFALNILDFAIVTCFVMLLEVSVLRESYETNVTSDSRIIQH